MNKMRIPIERQNYKEGSKRNSGSEKYDIWIENFFR